MIMSSYYSLLHHLSPAQRTPFWVTQFRTHGWSAVAYHDVNKLYDKYAFNFPIERFMLWHRCWQLHAELNHKHTIWISSRIEYPWRCFLYAKQSYENPKRECVMLMASRIGMQRRHKHIALLLGINWCATQAHTMRWLGTKKKKCGSECASLPRCSARSSACMIFFDRLLTWPQIALKPA